MKKLLLIFAVFLASCIMTERPQEPVCRVFFMYDNIGSEFDNDVEEALDAVRAGALDNQERVVVFQRASSGCKIIELTATGRVTLKVYPAGVNATLSPAVIANVVSDVRAMYPSATNWGLAFGSHGMGWLSKDGPFPSRRGGTADGFEALWGEHGEGDMTRYFQDQSQNRIDVAEFADAMDDWKWDFLILDDCFMASVEALYRMRKVAEYIIASPTEIMMTGFPYDRVVKTIFTDWTDMKGVGEQFIDYYASRTDGYPCGTIAVVRSSMLEPLAKKVKEFGLGERESVDVSAIQHYEGFASPGHVFHDMKAYLHAIDPIQSIDLVKDYIPRAIVYAGHTTTFYSAFEKNNGGFIAIDDAQFSGLSIFIPRTQVSSLEPSYRLTDWYAAVYL